jgi:geranylgeranyl diphosphate synthase type I
MTSLQTTIERYLPPLEAEMQAVVTRSEPVMAGLYGMLRYHMGWADRSFAPCRAGSGKRVRPVLCLLVCEACGGDWRQALPAAAAVELLHNFSLIHDDIEDRDRTRRGRMTLWAAWGEARAINAGDALFTLAELALLRQTGPARAALPDALELFNRTCLALTEGQHLDIDFEDRDELDIEEYLVMIARKTAALLACACELGALIAGAPGDGRGAEAVPRARLRSYGHHLGLAFQMRDDLLGVWGDPTLTGKPAGADLARRKKTLPIVHGIVHSPELRALLARKTPLSDKEVWRATELLDATESRAYTERLAQEHHERASAALRETGLAGPAVEALHELNGLLAGRQK